MKFNRRTNTIILWIISIGLLLGMIITFTPTLGRLGGSGGGNSHGKVELEVNGQPIYQDAVTRARQTPLYNAVSTGEVGNDLQLLMVDNLIQNALLAQASAKVRVSGREVNKAVDSFRSSRGVAGRKNDQAYLNLIGNAGFTDATFRQYVRESLRQSKWEGQLTKDVTVTDAEVKAWYDTHHSSYQTSPQIKAREIVVDNAELAVQLQKQAVGGADFAALAKANSKQLADRGGALGAAKGKSVPQPVGKPALPTAVANAAFGLQGPGITDVVSAAGQFYIVKVEAYLPSQLKPFDKVKDQVKADALKAKQTGVVQQKIDALKAAAKITVPAGSDLSYNNPVVAKVGTSSITAADLDRATYTNPQIQQALSPQSASLVTQFFKPAVLGQLIDTYVAYQGAQKLGLQLVGTRQMVAQAALNYVSRDATATDAAMKTYYDSNKANFTIPAQADATRVNFTSKANAEAFRKALLAGKAVDASAKADSGTVKNLGTVKPGDLVTELDTALFKTKAFTSLPSSKQGISDVLVLSQPVKSGSSAASGSSATGQGTSSTTSGTSSSGSSSSGSSSSGSSSSGSSSSGASSGSGSNSSSSASSSGSSSGSASSGSASSGSASSSGTSSGTASAGSATSGTASSSNSGGGSGSNGASKPQTKDTYVVLVAVRTPARTRTFAEVKDQVRSAVLSNQQQTLRSDWLTKVKKQVTVDNMLSQVQKQQAGSSGSGNGAAGSAGSGGTPAGSSGTGASSGSGSGSSSGGSSSGGSSSGGATSGGTSNGTSSGGSSNASPSGTNAGSSGSGN